MYWICVSPTRTFSKTYGRPHGSFTSNMSFFALFDFGKIYLHFHKQWYLGELYIQPLNKHLNCLLSFCSFDRWISCRRILQNNSSSFICRLSLVRVTLSHLKRHLMSDLVSLKSLTLEVESAGPITLMPAERHLPTASGTAARGGSIMEMRPRKQSWSVGKFVSSQSKVNPRGNWDDDMFKWQKPAGEGDGDWPKVAEITSAARKVDSPLKSQWF